MIGSTYKGNKAEEIQDNKKYEELGLFSKKARRETELRQSRGLGS